MSNCPVLETFPAGQNVTFSCTNAGHVCTKSIINFIINNFIYKALLVEPQLQKKCCTT